MESHTKVANLPKPARVMLWLLAALLFMMPFAAMQFTEEVRWSGADFAVWALLLALVLGAVELAARVAPNRAMFALFVLLAVAMFLGAWAQLSVGMI